MDLGSDSSPGKKINKHNKIPQKLFRLRHFANKSIAESKKETELTLSNSNQITLLSQRNIYEMLCPQSNGTFYFNEMKNS